MDQLSVVLQKLQQIGPHVHYLSETTTGYVCMYVCWNISIAQHHENLSLWLKVNMKLQNINLRQPPNL